MSKNKNKKIAEVVICSIIITWFVAIATNFGNRIPSRNFHYELFGIWIPISSFLIPIIKKSDYQMKSVYWSKENIISQIITIIVNLIPIIIMNYNYHQYYSIGT